MFFCSKHELVLYSVVYSFIHNCVIIIKYIVLKMIYYWFVCGFILNSVHVHFHILKQSIFII